MFRGAGMVSPWIDKSNLFQSHSFPEVPAIGISMRMGSSVPGYKSFSTTPYDTHTHTRGMMPVPCEFFIVRSPLSCSTNQTVSNRYHAPECHFKNIRNKSCAEHIPRMDLETLGRRGSIFGRGRRRDGGIITHQQQAGDSGHCRAFGGLPHRESCLYAQQFFGLSGPATGLFWRGPNHDSA